MAGTLKVGTITTPSGSGTITIPSGVTLSGISNTPAFMAYLTSGQSIANSTDTKIQCNSEIVDTNSAYDNSTNYRFTVPADSAGKYLVFWQVRRSNFSSTTLRGIVYINGSAANIATSENYNGSATYASAGNSIILNLSVGDYIELYAHQNSGSSNSIYGSGTDKATYFGAYKLLGV
jgi:hypothetical protein